MIAVYAMVLAPFTTCGCLDQPVDDCDCDGNQLDAVGLCGGTCTEDADNDGVCDTEEIEGCTDNLACNYLDIATEENNSCLYFDAIGECGGNCELGHRFQWRL